MTKIRSFTPEEVDKLPGAHVQHTMVDPETGRQVRVTGRRMGEVRWFAPNEPMAQCDTAGRLWRICHDEQGWFKSGTGL